MVLNKGGLKKTVLWLPNIMHHTFKHAHTVNRVIL